MSVSQQFAEPVFITNRPCNNNGIELIKNFAVFSSIPKLNSSKMWVIGYEHTRTVRVGMQITKDQADVLLNDDLAIVARAVQRLVKVELNDNQFATLVSFTFNVGITNFEHSVLLKLLNRGWYDQVPAQLARWNRINKEKSDELERRRRAEAFLWRENAIHT